MQDKEFKISRIGPFRNSDDVLFIYKKSERIAAALYLVSNFLSDTEPMKEMIRKKMMLLVDYASSGNQKPMLQALLAVLSSVEVAFSSGLMSNMNYSILKDELEELIKIIDRKSLSGNAYEEKLSSPRFFEIGVAPHEHSKLKGQSKQIGKMVGNVRESKGQSGERREIMIKMLKDRSNLIIKDFTAVITNCSEKTIQRELLKMVNEGVLKKAGERRWSRYSLV